MVRRMARLVRVVEPVRKSEKISDIEYAFVFATLSFGYVYFFKYIPLNIKYDILKQSVEHGSKTKSRVYRGVTAHRSSLGEAADHSTEV